MPELKVADIGPLLSALDSKANISLVALALLGLPSFRLLKPSSAMGTIEEVLIFVQAISWLLAVLFAISAAFPRYAGVQVGISKNEDPFTPRRVRHRFLSSIGLRTSQVTVWKETTDSEKHEINGLSIIFAMKRDLLAWSFRLTAVFIISATALHLCAS